MKRIGFATAVAFAFSLAACEAPKSATGPTVITHVAVIDVVSGDTRQDMTVVTSGARIQSVERSATASVPQGARIIDGRGKYLIPGLWDMDVHAFLYVFSDFAGPLMIANGVTGARDMGYHIDTTLRWRRDIAAGTVVGPRLVAGVRVDGNETKAKFVAHLTSAEDGARAVDTLARRKDGARRADFIETDSWIPRDAFFGLAREAKKIATPFAGRVPYSVSVIEAADAGERSIEHEDDIIRACSSRDIAMRSELLDTTKLSPAKQVERSNAHARILSKTFDETKCRAVYQALVRNKVWLTPTLISYQPALNEYDSASTHPELAKYVPGIVQAGWLRRVTVTTPLDSVARRAFFSMTRTAEMHRAGIQVLAGTDTPQPFVFPGFSLHDELQLLVKAGLSPLDALRTATYNPALYLNATDSLGSINTGKLADLVLLNGDPLENIANTRRIALVIANGRVYDRAELNKLLAGVAANLKR